MGSLFVVKLYPLVQVRLQLVDRLIEFLPKGYPVELIEHRLVKPLTDPVGLRTLCLGARMIDVLQRQIQLILVMLRITAVLGSPVRQHSQ